MTRLEKVNSFLNDPIFLSKASPDTILKFKNEKLYLENKNISETGNITDLKWLFKRPVYLQNININSCKYTITNTNNKNIQEIRFSYN